MSSEDALSLQRMEDLRKNLGVSPVVVAIAHQPAAAVAAVAPSPAVIVKRLELTEKLRAVVSVANTPIALGMLTFLILLVLLLTAKPSFFGSDFVDDKGTASKKANVRLCFFFAAICGGAVIAVPYLIRMYTGKNIATAVSR